MTLAEMTASSGASGRPPNSSTSTTSRPATRTGSPAASPPTCSPAVRPSRPWPSPGISSRKRGGASAVARARASEPEYLYLTTTGRRTGQPREIEIWFTRHGGRYYLVAETGERAQWIRNLRADARVSWRLGRRRLTGRARVVDLRAEPGLHRAVRRRSEAKYGWGDGLVVELTPARG
ncbi:MAG: hypothetical protein DMD79_05420 [Candidatus Rokuibacteriota bacterium]|nr:MAG: hypothetical protein DMD79_05420 [Candidatus Rokubacteria bacterium]